MGNSNQSEANHLLKEDLNVNKIFVNKTTSAVESMVLLKVENRLKCLLFNKKIFYRRKYLHWKNIPYKEETVCLNFYYDAISALNLKMNPKAVSPQETKKSDENSLV
jgi:hypothetical protein